MQRLLALAWLLETINAVLVFAGDGFPGPASTSNVLRINQTVQNQLKSSVGSRTKPLFDLKVSIPPDGNLVKVSNSVVDDELFEESSDQGADFFTSNRRSSEQYAESFPDEQRESIFPSPSSVSKPPSTEAIPLDGAMRDEMIGEDDRVVRRLRGDYSSLGWIAGERDRLGILEWDFKPSSRIRFDPSLQNKEYLGVEWGAKWLNGPVSTDLPPYLFNILINVGQKFQWNDKLAIDAMISPGWFTDFSNKGVDAFRLPWHLVSYYQFDPDWHWVMGVTDLSRDDIQYLPVLGTVYAPVQSNVRLDLVFPKPRIAWRFDDGDRIGQSWRHGSSMEVGEQKTNSRWLTLGGELGGGSYAISRSDHAYDVVTYRDYRLIAGLETRSKVGNATRLEVGWVFDRAVEYRSGNGNYNPGNSVMIRISSDY